ncbi:MAG: FtsX-like permease family protein [Planctomycetota bacterium]
MLRMAFLNIFRNSTRSLLTAGVIACGGAAVICAQGFIVNSMTNMEESYIGSMLGHLQIAQDGHFAEATAHPYRKLVMDAEAVVREVEGVSGVKAVTPRLSFTGLIGGGDGSVPCVGLGVEPAGDRKMGQYLWMKQGADLEGPEDDFLVIGLGLAEALRVNLGDTLMIAGTTVKGRVNDIVAPVKGVFATASKAFDDRAVRVSIGMARRFLKTRGVQTIVVLLDRTEDTDRIAAALRSRFREKGWVLEVKPWHEMEGVRFIHDTRKLYDRLFGVMNVILVVIVVLGVYNTMNMAVHERIGEIGTMRALGTRRGRVVRMFLLEGVALGVIGGVTGMVLGYALAKILTCIGIPMPVPPGTTWEWVAYIDVVPWAFGAAFGLCLFTAAASSLFPAMKASRTDTAEALRHNV